MHVQGLIWGYMVQLGSVFGVQMIFAGFSCWTRFLAFACRIIGGIVRNVAHDLECGTNRA